MSEQGEVTHIATCTMCHSVCIRCTPWRASANFFPCIFGQSVRRGSTHGVCFTANLANNAFIRVGTLGGLSAWSNPAGDWGKISFKCVISIVKQNCPLELFLFSYGTSTSLHWISGKTDFAIWRQKNMWCSVKRHYSKCNTSLNQKFRYIKYSYNEVLLYCDCAYVSKPTWLSWLANDEWLGIISAIHIYAQKQCKL